MTATVNSETYVWDLLRQFAATGDAVAAVIEKRNLRVLRRRRKLPAFLFWRRLRKYAAQRPESEAPALLEACERAGYPLLNAIQFIDSSTWGDWIRVLYVEEVVRLTALTLTATANVAFGSTVELPVLAGCRAFLVGAVRVESAPGSLCLVSRVRASGA